MENHTQTKISDVQEAIKTNDFIKLQNLLREGYSLEEQDTQGNLPIHIAAANGNIKIIKYLLDLKSPLNHINREQQNPLHIAAAHGHNEAVALLIRESLLQAVLTRKSNLQAVDTNLRTALHLAVENKQVRVVKQLLDAKVNVFMQDQMGSTALHIASTYGFTNILRLIYKEVPLETFIYLLKMQDKDGKTPIHCAAFNGDTNYMRALLRRGANINAINDYGNTPLFYAICNNNLEMVKLLLERGAFLFIENINNQNPIQYARDLMVESKLMEALSSARRRAIKHDPKTFTDSISQMLLKGDKALDVKEQRIARRYYYQALSQSHHSEDIHLTLWSWQKVLKLSLVQQNFSLAAKALMAMEQTLCHEQHVPFLPVEKVEQSRWLADYQFSILKQCVKAFCQDDFLNTALVHLDKFKGEVSTDNLTQQRRQQLVSLRSEVKQNLLEDATPIPALLAQITEKFKGLVRDIVTYSMHVLGEPPCEFALVSLGSMSRDEMITHSDLECAILIKENTETNMQYFRHLTILMELQLIFLGETPVKGEYLSIESPIASGFCLDSDAGLSPLGIKDAFELIGTPYHLAQFHESKRFMGAERVQANALKNVSLIAGNEKLITLYYDYMGQILAQKNQQNSTLRQQQALIMLKDELKWFAPDLSKKKLAERSFNIKDELHRLPNTILNNLAVYYNLTSKNAWDRIKELQKKGKLTHSTSQHLQNAISEIVKLRLETHLHYQSEIEIIHHRDLSKEASSDNSSLADSRLHFSMKQAQQLLIIYRVLFPLHRVMKVFVDTQGKDKRFKKENLVEDVLTAQGEAFMHTSQYEKAIEVYQNSLAANPNDIGIRLKLAQAYSLSGDADKQKELLIRTWRVYKRSNGSNPLQGLCILTNLSATYAQLNDMFNHQQYALLALAFCNKYFGEKHVEMAKCKIIVADSYGKVGQLERQIAILQEALIIYGGQEQEDMEADKGAVLVNLGIAYSLQGHYAQAKDYLEQGLALEKKAYGDKHPTVATTLISLANVYGALWDISKEIKLLQTALAIQKSVYGKKDPQIAITYNNLGNAFGKLKKMPLCIKYLECAFQMHEKHSQRAITIINLSKAYVNIWEREKLEGELKRLDKLIGLLITTNQVSSKELTQILNGLNETYSLLKDKPKAATLIEKVLALQEALQLYASQQTQPSKTGDDLQNKEQEKFIHQELDNDQEIIDHVKQADNLKHKTPSSVPLLNNFFSKLVVNRSYSESDSEEYYTAQSSFSEEKNIENKIVNCNLL